MLHWSKIEIATPFPEYIRVFVFYLKYFFFCCGTCGIYIVFLLLRNNFTLYFK